MGRILVIKGADFSTNALTQNDYMNPDDFALVSAMNRAMLPLGHSVGIGDNFIVLENMTRVGLFDFVITPYIKQYTKLRIVVEEGFDIAIATVSNSDAIVFYDNNGVAGGVDYFVWVTNTQTVEVDLKTQKHIYFNIRYEDNVTQFANNDLTKYLKVYLS